MTTAHTVYQQSDRIGCLPAQRLIVMNDKLVAVGQFHRVSHRTFQPGWASQIRAANRLPVRTAQQRMRLKNWKRHDGCVT
jgi:hypothetical protein